MTTLLKWSPLTELDLMDRRMRRMFEGLGFAPHVLPATDVFETEKEFVFEVEVPGYEEKDLGIEISDHTLTIKGERVEAKKREETAYRLHERLEHEFERRFHLPAEADTERLEAQFGKGVLTVHAPKLVVTEPKKIEITKP
jgi:HSP20 family protein